MARVLAISMHEELDDSQTSLAPATPADVLRMKVFYGMPPDRLAELAAAFELRHFAPGDVVLRQDEEADAFYIISQGHVAVWIEKGGEELVIAREGPGDCFGEKSLLENRRRTASVTALDQLEVLRMTAEDFAALSLAMPELRLALEKVNSGHGGLVDDPDTALEIIDNFRVSKRAELDFSYIDNLMLLNQASGGLSQVEHCKECGALAHELSQVLCPLVSEDLRFAGYVHEIGKVCLSRGLLERERRGQELSSEERERVSRIFEVALDILKERPNLYERVTFLAAMHCDDYRQMPLQAQILKVADDYLMLRHPEYRGRSEEEALAAITAGSGTRYNPRVVTALERRLAQYRALTMESQLTVMRMMVVALDRKDNYTFRHSMDVRNMGLEIVRRLDLTYQEREYYRIGAELHDVGKIYIDESILNAPRKLTDEEFEVMKTHAAWSADFFRNLPGMSELATIVRGHHERFDGTGYPDGKSGREEDKRDGTGIPLLTRIMTIADVWSALTTRRVYRTKNPTPAEAVDIMRKMAPGHFDPDLFPIFCEIVRERIEPS